MALDIGELLADAVALEARGTESGYRSAINRRYYAGHLDARDGLFGPDAVRWSGSSRRPSHRAVIDELWRDSALSEAAQRLDDLKTMREVADYVRGDDHPEVRALPAYHGASDWEGLAARASTLAREIIAILRESLPAN